MDVELGTNILGFPKAAYGVGLDGPRTEIVANGYEGDTYEDVVGEPTNMLRLWPQRRQSEPKRRMPTSAESFGS